MTNTNTNTNTKAKAVNYGAELGWELGVDFPKWGNTMPYVTTISNGYLSKGETPRLAYERVANAVAKRLDKPELASKFFDYIWKGWLCLATPVLANTGTTRGLSISCYGIHSEDSIYGIGEKVKEMMLMAKHGGGVGINLSDIRPSGAPITDNGTSDGVVPFTKIFDSAILATNQGSVRRGMAVTNLSIEHEDFEEWLTVREGKGEINRQCNNIHLSAIVPDSFMEKVEAGDPEARRKWTLLLKQRKLTGEHNCSFVQ